MHLAHPRHIQQAEQALHFKLRTSLLIGLPRSALGGGLVQLHKTGRQRPLTQARFDIAFAQKDLVAPMRHGAHHIQRVLVMHGVAHGADRARFEVTIVGQAVHHFGAAFFAMLNGGSQHSGA